MLVVVPTPLLLKVPALVNGRPSRRSCCCVMSASSVTLNVPLFWNSEPGLAPPLELMFRLPPLRLATPLLTSVRAVLPPLPKVFCDRAAHRQRGRVVDRGGAGTGERTAGPVEGACDVLRPGASQRARTC